MKGERNCSRASAALRQRERQEKRFLRFFDGVDFDDIVIIVATSKRGNWEIEIRVSSNCIRRRNNKKN
jgi:cytidylate kinase